MPNGSSADGSIPRRKLPAMQDGEFLAFLWSLRLLLASLLISIVLVQVLAGICLVIWLDLMIRRKFRYVRTRLDIPILAWLAVRLLTVLFSVDPALSATAISREMVFYLSFYFSVFAVGHSDHESVLVTLRWVVYSTVIVTIISSAQYLSGSVVRANGLTGGGTLATGIALVVPAVLVLARDGVLAPNRVLGWGVLAVLLAGLLCTLFRGDLLGVTLVLCLFAFRFNRWLIPSAAAIVIVVALAVPSIAMRLMTLADPLHHTSDRLTLWNAAMSRAGEHPVTGFGPETFPVVFNDVPGLADRKIGGWHNDWVQIYMESGLLGVVAWIYVIVTAFILSIRLIRRRGAQADSRAGWIVTLALIGWSVSGMFGTPVFSITNAILFRFLIAWAAVSALPHREAA